MTTKHSSIHLASEGSFDTTSTDSLAEMRSLVAEYQQDPNGAVLDDWEPREGTIVTEVRAISARINQNYDAWPSDELKAAHHTFIGKPVFINHNNHDPDRARGRVVASRYVDAGEEDRYIQVLQEVEASRFPKLAKELMEGGLDSVSMGAEAREVECSYCGNISTSPFDACEHIPMKGATLQRRTASGTKEDVLVYEICRKISFFELSYVFDPADETAVASNVLVAGRREAVSEVEVPPKVDTLHPDEDEKSQDDWQEFVDDPNVIDTIDVLDEPDLGLNQELERSEDEVPEGFEEFENVDEQIEENEQAEKEFAQDARQKSKDKEEAEAEEAQKRFEKADPEDEKNWEEEDDGTGGKTSRFKRGSVEAMVADDYGTYNMWVEKNGSLIASDSYTNFREAKSAAVMAIKQSMEEKKMSANIRRRTSRRMTADAWGDGIMKLLNETGGFSFRDNPGDGPTTGYMVAVADEKPAGTGDNVPDDVRSFMQENSSLLSQPDHYMGGWEENGKLIMDVSRHVEDLDEAIRIGLEKNQRAIYDVANGRDINLDQYRNARRKARRKQADADKDLYVRFLEYAKNRGIDLEHIEALYMSGQETSDVHQFEEAMYDFLDVDSVDDDPRLYTLLEAPGIYGISGHILGKRKRATRKTGGTVTIYTETMTQEDIDFGASGEVWEDVYDNVDVDEAVDILERHGLTDSGNIDTFYAPDSYMDPYSGNVEVTTGAISGFSPAEEDQIGGRLRSASRKARRKQADDHLDAPGVDMSQLRLDGLGNYGDAVAVVFDDSGNAVDLALNWETAQSMAQEGYNVQVVRGDGGRSQDEIQRMVDHEKELVRDLYGSRNGGHHISRTNTRATSRKDSRMAPQRRRRIGDNKQTPLLEETGIAQTPAEEPAVDPGEGADAPNNSESDRVKSARRALAREIARDRAIKAHRRTALNVSEMSDFDLQEMHGELENDVQDGNDSAIAQMEEIEAEADKRGLDLYDPNFDPNERAFMSRRRRAKAVGQDLSGDSVKREDLFQDYPATTMTAKLHKRFAAWVQENYGASLRQASSPGELRSWARAFSREAGIDLPHLHAAIKRDVHALRTAEDKDDLPDFIEEKIEDDEDEGENKQARRRAIARRRAAQARNARGRRTQTTRRRTADDKLDLAAPGDRVNVEKPTSGTTDADAEASQFDKADFDNNSGKGLENPDTTPTAGTPGGPSVNDLKKTSRATGLQAVRLAEAMIAAGLIEDSTESKFKAAAQFEQMSRDIVLDRTALLEKVAKVHAGRRSSTTKNAGNRGSSLNSAVPPNMSGMTRSSAPQTREASTDNDSDLFI